MERRLLENKRRLWNISAIWVTRSTQEIKSSISNGKGSKQQEKIFLHQKIGLTFKKKISKVLHLEHDITWCWNLDTSESRSEIPGNLWNVVLQKEGEDQFDRSCEELRSVTESQGERNILHTVKIWKDHWIGYILRSNCLLKYISEENIEWRIEVTGRWRRRRSKQLLDGEEEEVSSYWMARKKK